MRKIQLENNEGWFVLDGCTCLLNNNGCNRSIGNIVCYYLTPKGSVVVEFKRRGGSVYGYRKATGKDMEIFTNRYKFPQEEEI